MKTRSWVLVLWFLGGLASGQDEAPDSEYLQTVDQGRQATAADAEALRVQALVKENEEAGAYQDGEFEKTEPIPEVVPAVTPPPPPTDDKPLKAPQVPLYGDGNE